MKLWKLWAAGAVLLSAPACANFHPLHPQQWPVRYDPLFNPVVSIQTGYAFAKQVHNGVIVHSSTDHGTYLLTTLEAVVEGAVKVMIYDYSHEELSEASMGIYEVEIKAKDATRDLVLARLLTRRLFKAARFHPEEARPHFYDKRLAVHMVSISPEHYPHLEEVKIDPKGEWRIAFIDGAAGSPIFCEGLMIGLYSEERWRRAITLREIYEFLEEYGFAFIR